MREDWAGIPMPIAGQKLVIEPTYPKAKELSEIGQELEEPIPDDVKFRNSFWSKRLRAEIYIWEEGGRIWSAPIRQSRAELELNTLDASRAWGIEQEAKAIQLLATLLPHHKFKQYMLTGMFLESSARSGVAYLFRKLRPTLAIKAPHGSESVRVLCALCMHPIAYYGDSWAGAMTPTDDVVAHLMLMRADEAAFWKRCNQHPADRPQAGL